MEVVRHPNDATACSAYIYLLKDYVDSGLLEGHLLLRQRMVLEQALGALPDNGLTPELMNIRVSNLLELQHPAEARGCAEKMISLWPQDESGWLALLHMCLDTRDREGLRMLLNHLAKRNVNKEFIEDVVVNDALSLLCISYSLDCKDITAIAGTDRYDTRSDKASIFDDRTCTTLSLGASFFCTCKTQVFPDDI